MNKLSPERQENIRKLAEEALVEQKKFDYIENLPLKDIFKYFKILQEQHDIEDNDFIFDGIIFVKDKYESHISGSDLKGNCFQITFEQSQKSDLTFGQWIDQLGLTRISDESAP